MFYVYCLISHKNPKFHYYGFTEDLDERVRTHKLGKVRTTNRFAPVELLGYKTFESRIEALKFEKDLKAKASYRKTFLKELLGSPA